jgi:hypothetical protein
MIRWTPELDAKLMAMVSKGMTWKEVGLSIGVSWGACAARWKRLREAPRERAPRPTRVYQERSYKNLKPHNNPSEPDSSSVKFAYHDLHLRLIAEAMQRGEHLPGRRAAA